MSLGDRINQIRKEKKISIDELCMRSGVPKGTLSKITAGITTNPTLDTVQAIARALDCTLDEFDDTPIPYKINSEELTHVQKYRLLEEDDKKKIDTHMDDLLQAAENKRRLADAIKEADARMTSGFTLVAAGGDPKIGVASPGKEKIQSAIEEAEKRKKRK